MDFVPGDQYRLDIVGADSTIIVDSWTGQVKANIIGMDGSLIVDITDNKVYGPTVGNVENMSGEVVLDTDNKFVNATLKGDVYTPDNELILDHESSTLYGNFAGNLTDQYGDVIVDADTKTINADSFSGDFFGNFYGTLSSDSVIYGALEGDFTGNGHGNFNGEFYGVLQGETDGIHRGPVVGDLTGNVTGELAVDDNNLATAPDDISGRKSWLGSVNHADGSVILKNSPNRNEVSFVGNIEKLDGTKIIDISEDVTRLSGQLKGELIDINNKAIVTSTDHGVIIAPDLPLTLGSTEYPSVIKNKHTYHYTPQANFIADYKHFCVGLDENGDFTDIDPKGKTFTIESTARYNGDDKMVGMIRFNIDETKPIDPNSIFLPGEIHIRAFGGKNVDDYDAKLTITSDGVVRSRIFQADGMDFIKRDSLVAQEGMIIFNKNTKKFQGFDGQNWVDLH
jgi:hypothetical protein